MNYVERIVAVGGDLVEVVGKEVRVNGQVLEHRACEPGERSLTVTRVGAEDTFSANAECLSETGVDGRAYPVVYQRHHERRGFGPETLRPGEVFVMGDARDNSFDSRFYGPIEAGSIVGRAFEIYFSYSASAGFRWRRIGMRL